MKCPATPLGRGKCAEFLRTHMAALGSEITVSTAPPLVIGPYGVNGYTCPHGVHYWIQPTGEQIAQWVETRTP